MKKISIVLMTLVFITMLCTPAFAATEDIVEIAVGNDDFSILVTALTEADLVGALQGDGPFTVFAPTDAAFGDLLAALDITAADLLAQPGLADVLLYHVVSGQVMSTDLTDGMMAETLQGESLTIDLSDGVKVNDATVTAPDLEATNGVIHVIDSVLIPEGFALEMPPEEMPDTGGAPTLAYAFTSLSLAAMLVGLKKRI